MVTMQRTVTTHKDVQNDVDSNTSKTVIKIGLSVQIELKSGALHIKADQNIMKQINKQVLRHMPRFLKINQKTKANKAQTKASEAQTQIVKNLENILTSQFCELESRIEQKAKGANKWL